MAKQQQFHGGGAGEGDNLGDAAFNAGQAQIDATGTDDLLDEIDALLDSNAEEFVRSFVQKGGQ